MDQHIRLVAFASGDVLAIRCVVARESAPVNRSVSGTGAVPRPQAVWRHAKVSQLAGVVRVLYASADTVAADEPQYGHDRDHPEDRMHREPERRSDHHDDDCDEDVH